MALAPGDPAPDFTLPDQDGNAVSLSGLRGKTVVLYFYPKADTPGCTDAGLRRPRPSHRLRGRPTRSCSASPRTRSRRWRKFDQKFDLGFPLLADEDHAVAEPYGVWVEKSMYGRTYMGNERTTFVIAPDGTIKDVLRKVKPAEHDDLVLAALGAGA